MLALYFADLRPYLGELQERAVGKDNFSQERYRLDALHGLAGQAHQEDGPPGPINTFDLMILGRAAQASALFEPRIARLEAALQDRSEDQWLRGQLEQAEREKLHWQAMSPQFQLFCFLLLFIGFAIQVPAIPLHTWLPDALADAPASVSMLLAALLPAVGAYGILRIAIPLCPLAAQQLAWIVCLVGVVGIVYAALVALAQTDILRLIAYGSISQMGYVLLGMAAWASPDSAQYWTWSLKGAVYLILAHGITTAGMCYLAGLLRERLAHTDVTRMGGMCRAIPTFSSLAAVIFLGAMGLPLLCHFVGIFCVLLGCWNFRPDHWLAAGQVFSMVGSGALILTAGYIIWTLQRALLGPSRNGKPLDDLDGREGFVAGFLATLTVILGIWPMLVFDWLEPTLTGLVQTLAQVTGR
jgi:NADH-quinone oxidoreductase subunit M